MEGITVKGISKRFGNTPVLTGISLTAAQGECMALLGESGSGKTTLLRILAGLETPDQGTLQLNGIALDQPAEQRPVGLVFQDYALFPHLTVAKNICFGMTKKQDKPTILKEMLQLVDLEGFQKRYPHQLSGGQQQRVAIARALATKPDLLLLDEPFSNLDASLRKQVRQEISAILKHTHTTSLFVTHDLEDALAVADKIVVLAHGKNVRTASPPELCRHPKHPAVAALLGNWNQLEITIRSGKVAHGVHLPERLTAPLKDGQYTALFPYDAARPSSEKTPLSSRVDHSFYNGHGFTGTLLCQESVIRTFSREELPAGAEVYLELEEKNIQFYAHE